MLEKKPVYFLSNCLLLIKLISKRQKFGLLMWTYFFMCLKIVPFLLLEFRGFGGAVPLL